MTAPTSSTDLTGQTSEESLLAALRAGVPEAYEQLVREFAPRMLAVARRFLSREDDAQDAVQDAFLSAFKALATFQGDSRLATWLHRIAVNAALMKLRTARRKPETPIDNLLPSFHDDGHRAGVGSSWAATIDQTVEQRETRRLVRAAIEKLPESFRTVLLLRDIEERSTEETADLLELTESAVKTRLHRARLALRTLLDPHFSGAEE